MTAVAFDPLRDGGRRPLWRVYGYMWLRYKRTWRGTLTTSFLYPVLYLLAMGVGLGHLVDAHLTASGSLRRLGGVTYVEFIAPGLLAATSMQMASNEAMYPVMHGLKWVRTYHAMIAAPIPVRDVQLGHLTWIATRLVSSAGIFLCILAAFGDVRSMFAVLALPCAVLTGLAFAAPIMAFTATQENDNAFSLLYRMGIVPLFLFSGTFFPISQLPGALQLVARATPLYHGVSLCRGLVLGHLDAGAAVVHVAYLAALTGAGVVLGGITFRRRLSK